MIFIENKYHLLKKDTLLFGTNGIEEEIRKKGIFVLLFLTIKKDVLSIKNISVLKDKVIEIGYLNKEI